MTHLIRWAMLICIAMFTPGCLLTDAVWDPADGKTVTDPTILGAYRDADGKPRMLLARCWRISRAIRYFSRYWAFSGARATFEAKDPMT